jgi:hypothetical protein
VTAECLFQSLKCGLQALGICGLSRATCKEVIGVGTDGASTNIAARGLKGSSRIRVGLGFLDVVLSTSPQLMLLVVVSMIR